MQGMRGEVDGRTPYEGDGTRVPGAEVPKLLQRASWDGERYYGTQGALGEDPLRIVSENWRSGRTVTARPTVGAFLEGRLRFLGSEWSIFELLLSDPDAKLSDAMESVKGHPCWLVTSHGEDGHYAVWIDPAAIMGLGVHWGVFGLIGGVAGRVLLARAWERRRRPPSPRTFSQFFGGSGRAGRLCHDGGLEAATKRLAPRPVSRST